MNKKNLLLIFFIITIVILGFVFSKNNQNNSLTLRRAVILALSRIYGSLGFWPSALRLRLEELRYAYQNDEVRNMSKSTDKTSPNEKLKVTASFYPMYFFSSQIGGEKVEVRNITPASVEPHDYEPTAKDIARIEQSNMLVLNGQALESWGDKIKNELRDKNTVIVTASENIISKQINEEGKTIKDPHVWLDPTFAKEEVIQIEKGFEKADPKDAAYFQNNIQALVYKLDQLDNEYREGLKNCQKKDFVTSHQAFGYLASRYNINQIAIAGVSPNEEPSTKKLAEITNLVSQKGIKVIFFESLISPKLGEIIAHESNVKTMVLDPIEGLSDDDIKNGKNYFTIMKDNLKNLKLALECNK